MLPQGITQHTKEPSQECSPHHFLPTSGDIEVFKDMPIKELNLFRCNKLTGEWVKNLVARNFRNYVGRVLPQGNTQRNSSRNVLHFSSPLPSLQHTTLGDISVFKDMPIKELSLLDCKKLTGEWVTGQVARISGVAPGQHPKEFF